jgi:hypothetical protein
VWKTSKAVEEKVVDEIRRHWELFVEDLEVAGASRPWPSRRQRGRVWRGEAKAKVRMDLD